MGAGGQMLDLQSCSLGLQLYRELRDQAALAAAARFGLVPHRGSPVTLPTQVGSRWQAILRIDRLGGLLRSAIAAGDVVAVKAEREPRHGGERGVLNLMRAFENRSDTVVVDEALTRVVSSLRRLLGDDALDAIARDGADLVVVGGRRRSGAAGKGQRGEQYVVRFH